MNSWAHSPSKPQLSQYIERYWYLEKDAHEESLKYPRLIPNPLTHLVLTSHNQHSHYSIGNIQIALSGSHLIMPCNRFIEMDHHDSVVILGITFKAGAAYSCFPNTAEQKLNSVFKSTNKILSCLAMDTTERLIRQAFDDTETLVEQLDHFVAPLLEHVREDRHSVLTRQALHDLERVPLNELEHYLSCSKRTMERSFLRVTGYTLKQYETLKRLDRLIRHLYQNRSQTQNWADLALHFGFSDQPHLIRELKKTIGTTPAKYAHLRNLTIDAYGNFE